MDDTYQNQEEFVFRGQRNDERVLEVIRQHPWVMAKTAIILIILINILIILLIIFGASLITSMATFVFLIISVTLGWYRWYLWKNSIYILTDQRIIKIEQKSFFNRVISEAELERIQDIATIIQGAIKTMLNFGSINIQTASSQTLINLENLPDPYEIQQKIGKTLKMNKASIPGKMEFRDTFEENSKLKTQNSKPKIIH